MMSPGGNPISSVSMRYDRVQISSFRSAVSACPFSSNAITITAAPYRRTSRAFVLNASSPSLRLIEFTTPFPCTHLRPASMTLHLDESIMIGTRPMSGSAAMSRKNRSMAASESSNASSMLTSIIWAPFITC